jgi:hypothetical protein
MAVKAARKKSKSPAVRKATKSKPVSRKTVTRRNTAKPSRKPAKASVRKPRKGEPSLGRPLVRIEEKLYLLFKEDYEARQIFEFLRVETVGDLEKFSAQQIIQILSTPVRRTVERIRERLAENKRSLRDDASFAREYLSTHDGR